MYSLKPYRLVNLFWLLKYYVIFILQKIGVLLVLLYFWIQQKCRTSEEIVTNKSISIFLIFCGHDSLDINSPSRNIIHILITFCDSLGKNMLVIMGRINQLLVNSFWCYEYNVVMNMVCSNIFSNIAKMLMQW